MSELGANERVSCGHGPRHIRKTISRRRPWFHEEHTERIKGRVRDPIRHPIDGPLSSEFRDAPHAMAPTAAPCRLLLVFLARFAVADFFRFSSGRSPCSASTSWPTSVARSRRSVRKSLLRAHIY
jgi:hypothetical protein